LGRTGEKAANGRKSFRGTKNHRKKNPTEKSAGGSAASDVYKERGHRKRGLQTLDEKKRTSYLVKKRKVNTKPSFSTPQPTPTGRRRGRGGHCHGNWGTGRKREVLAAV